jgi:trehalose 6-phosphate phosphatase
VVVAAAHDKADALLALVTRSSAAAALFIGDDVNDEPVFQRAQPGWLTIRIGRDAPQSAAQYFLNCIADLPTLLDKLLPWPA